MVNFVEVLSGLAKLRPHTLWVNNDSIFSCTN